MYLGTFFAFVLLLYFKVNYEENDTSKQIYTISGNDNYSKIWNGVNVKTVTSVKNKAEQMVPN